MRCSSDCAVATVAVPCFLFDQEFKLGRRQELRGHVLQLRRVNYFCGLKRRHFVAYCREKHRYQRRPTLARCVRGQIDEQGPDLALRTVGWLRLEFLTGRLKSM